MTRLRAAVDIFDNIESGDENFTAPNLPNTGNTCAFDTVLDMLAFLLKPFFIENPNHKCTSAVVLMCNFFHTKNLAKGTSLFGIFKSIIRSIHAAEVERLLIERNMDSNILPQVEIEVAFNAFLADIELYDRSANKDVQFWGKRTK